MKWITNCWKTEERRVREVLYQPNRHIISGAPQATKEKTTAELIKWDVIGLYDVEESP